jgi:hypothetical protein
MSSSERLQVLITPDQRRRLDAAARARGQAVTALVRLAIDEVFPPGPDLAQRRAAARTLTERRVEYLPPERIDELLADRFDVDPGVA